MPHGYYFFSGDYIRDTLHLGWLEDCAYRRLLDLYYLTGKPLRNDRQYLMRAVRAVEPEHQAAVDAVLAEFFTLRTDGWHNGKADRRLVVEHARSEGGKKGAETRWGKNKDLDDGKPLASQSQANAPFPSLPLPSLPLPSLPSPTPPARPSDSLGAQPPASPPSPRSARKQPRAEAAAVGDSVFTWKAYSAAYVNRYGTEPVRNATVNAQLAALVRRLGKDEAPQVAAFYLSHGRTDYVRAKHSAGLLLRDAEGLRTEWATGHKVTDAEARQTDRRENNRNVYDVLRKELSDDGEPN